MTAKATPIREFLLEVSGPSIKLVVTYWRVDGTAIRQSTSFIAVAIRMAAEARGIGARVVGRRGFAADAGPRQKR